MTKKMIPVSAPILDGNEKKYVLDCLNSTWISSSGEYLERFERSFAAYCGAQHAIACCNGTVALHLALLAVGVGPGDEVIVPTISFVATANAVTYCGAKPVFMDVTPDTWNLDCTQLEARLTPRTKAIITVHLYGHPVDMDEITRFALRHGLVVIEDAAEALGSRYKTRPVGSLGHLATFSFYGNKLITTGEGGMVVTDDPELAGRLRLLKGQGMDPKRRYWHPVIGYNYRMTNVAAAIGLAQLERVDEHLSHRQQLASWYKRELAGEDRIAFQRVDSDVYHSFWMVTVLLRPNAGSRREDVMASMLGEGVETRPMFYPMHALPPYLDHQIASQFPVADSVSKRGICLPTSSAISEEDVATVVGALTRALP